MLALIVVTDLRLPSVNWPLQIVWKLFDMAIGGIQAFIFALLTVIYYAQASESHSNETEALLETEEESEGSSGGSLDPGDPARPRSGILSAESARRGALNARPDRPTPADTHVTDHARPPYAHQNSTTPDVTGQHGSARPTCNSQGESWQTQRRWKAPSRPRAR